MSSIFTRIINGEIPGFIVTENDRFVALLDAFPLVVGHTLVIPKEEVDYIFDVDDTMLADMMVFAKSISIAIQKAVPCTKIGICVIGLEVAHAHIHLIPINKVSDMDFTKPKLSLGEDEMNNTLSAIKSFLY
jgi:histidine triad (HIT) family protein